MADDLDRCSFRGFMVHIEKERIMKLNAIEPVGPVVEGVIRFASAGEGDTLKQLDHFDVLALVHEQDEAAKPKLTKHPIEARLAEKREAGDQPHVRVIPIKLMFNDPDVNLRARYEAYDSDLSRLACVGDGEKGCRANFASGTTSSVECAGPDACSFANTAGMHCSLHVRMKVQVEGQTDPFSCFELQSGGINTYRTLKAKLNMMHAAFGDKMRFVPLDLCVYAKSSRMSDYKPFYVADIRLRDGADLQAATHAATEAKERAGISDAVYGVIEAAVAKMIGNSPLSLDDSESDQVVFSPATPYVRTRRRPVESSCASDVQSFSINDQVSKAIENMKAAQQPVQLEDEIVACEVPEAGTSPLIVPLAGGIADTDIRPKISTAPAMADTPICF